MIAIVVLAALAAALVLAGSPSVAAWLYRLFHDPDPYDPHFAEAPHRCRLPGCDGTDVWCGRSVADPVDVQHSTAVRERVVRVVPVVPSGHEMCAGPCCREERLDQLVDSFDWHRYDYELRSR